MYSTVYDEVTDFEAGGYTKAGKVSASVPTVPKTTAVHTFGKSVRIKL